MMRALAFALLVLFATASFAGTGPEKLPDPAQEARAVALQKEFRCLVCQGESLDESNATLAEDLRKLIRARIEAGDTNAQIERYLVARYGEFILMKPPLEPQTYGLWFGPILVLLIGAGVAGMVILRARPKPQT
ncbi:MAG TPA: cytochrome c-type biogenesis protein [Rhizomicrobium sp.]|jgi:cytochrome c-type biogenesis protein CcmH|nr:cytochrome c-type biogenesis protein [Rhizomicrobium sp.]